MALRLILVLFVAALIVVACSVSETVVTKHPDGKVDTKAKSAELLTGNDSSATVTEATDPETGATKMTATASTRRSPKTAAEISAENRAAMIFWLFWCGIAGMAVCGIGYGIKIYGAINGVGVFLNVLGSMPVWLLNFFGLAGGSAFAFAVLPRTWQIGIAAVSLACIVLVIYPSWKSSYKGLKARKELNGGRP